MTRFLAAWTTQDAVGYGVAPRTRIRRVPCSITASTNRRAPVTVLVSKKSQASNALAWERRKLAHVVDARSGAGSIPAWRRISHTVEPATLMLRPSSSPWMRLYPSCENVELNISRGGDSVASRVTGLGHKVAPSAARQTSRDAGIDPVPRRSGQTWRAFLAGQVAAILAAGVVHAGTVLLRRLYVLPFTGHGTRRVHLVGITAHPAGERAARQARNLLMTLGTRLTVSSSRSGTGSQVHRGVRRGIHLRRHAGHHDACPAAASERYRGAPDRRCPDRMLITGERHLQLVPGHYNGHRPCQALQHDPPARSAHPATDVTGTRVRAIHVSGAASVAERHRTWSLVQLGQIGPSQTNPLSWATPVK